MHRRRDRPTERQTERQTDRKTDRHTERRTDREADQQKDRQTYREADGQRDRRTERQKDRETDGQRGGRTERQTDRETDGQRDRRTEREREGCRLHCEERTPYTGRRFKVRKLLVFILFGLYVFGRVTSPCRVAGIQSPCVYPLWLASLTFSLALTIYEGTRSECLCEACVHVLSLPGSEAAGAWVLCELTVVGVDGGFAGPPCMTYDLPYCQGTHATRSRLRPHPLYCCTAIHKRAPAVSPTEHRRPQREAKSTEYVDTRRDRESERRIECNSNKHINITR